MAIHRIYIDDGPLPAPGERPLTVGGEEAHHAVRVKRLQEGHRVQVLDGRGGMGEGTIIETAKTRAGWQVILRLDQVQQIEPVAPRVEVLCPPPKGPRLSELIDGLSQVGAAMWAPISTAFSTSDPRPGRLERTARIAAEASKQCGRPWLLEVGELVTLDDVLAERVGAGGMVMADASGGPYAAGGEDSVRLLVGPEGGWRGDELTRARDAGVQVARFGPHIMRIETAAPVATAIILDAELRLRG